MGAFADSYTNTAGGNWNATSIWTPTAPTGGPPNGSDIVVAASTGNLGVIASSTSMNSFTVTTSGATLTGGVTSGMANLAITGDFTVNSGAGYTVRNTSSNANQLTLSTRNLIVNGALNAGIFSSSSDLPLAKLTVTGSTSVGGGMSIGVDTTDITLGDLAVSGSLILNTRTSGTPPNSTKSIALTSLAGSGTISNSNINLASGTRLSTLAITTAPSANASFSGVLTDGSDSSTSNLSVSMAGSGTQALSGLNTYTGSTSISGGVLAVSTLASGGSSSGIGSSGNAAANLALNGGTLSYTGAGGATDRLFTLGVSGGTIAANGTGAIAFTNTGGLAYAGSGARTLTLGGASASSNSFASVLANGSGGVSSLAKTGSGKWILTSAQSYTGSTTIIAGTLVLSGSGSVASSSAIDISGSVAVLDVSGVTGGSYAVTSGQTLKGVGTVMGNVTTGSASVLSPGESAGTLAVNGSLAVGSFTSIDFDAGDEVAVTGNLTLGSSAVVALSSDLGPGTYDLFSFTGGLSGAANLSSWTASGLSHAYSFGSDSDSVYLSVVPEPAAWSLLGLGLLAVLLRRSRR